MIKKGIITELVTNMDYVKNQVKDMSNKIQKIIIKQENKDKLITR